MRLVAQHLHSKQVACVLEALLHSVLFPLWIVINLSILLLLGRINSYA